MSRRPLPTRQLPERPHLDQLKRQAKELLDAFRTAEPAAVAEVRRHYREPDPDAFALHDAQLVLARAYGFESWPKLKAYVDGATVARLVDAVRGGRLDEVRALLKVRPELAQMSVDNLQVVHHAVLAGLPDMVRLLMQHGADGRQGVYPYRDATTAHAIAQQSGRDDLVRLIEEEEHQRKDARGRKSGEASRRAASAPAAAVVRGDAEWLRQQYAQGLLTNDISPAGGLLRIAVTQNRVEILNLLLEWGFDPDERIRFTEGDENVAFSWGMPLQAAVTLGRYEMAEALLQRGADPNASIYASGDPMSAAYDRRDQRMIDLLERHGGMPTAGTIGAFGSVDLARRVLLGEAAARTEGDEASIAGEMLSEAARQGHIEIVRLALERVDWPPDAPSWFSMLEQTLRHDSPESATSWEDSPHLACFRLLLARCDPNLRGRPTDRQQFGLTTLHNIVARGNLAPAERVAFAAAILDRGASLDRRDHLLKSTPLGWASRWGHVPLVQLFLTRGADPVEPDSEIWARPLAWAERGGHHAVVTLLRRAAAS